MINFHVFKNGNLIHFKNEIQKFKINKFQTLFIFHGLYGRGRNWHTFSKRLSLNTNLIVITVDLRNHGGNVFKTNHSYHLMIEDIICLFQHLKIKKTNLLGHSMGGKLAMLLSLTYPNYINRLAVADIAPINYPNNDQVIIDSLLRLDLSKIKKRIEADYLLSKSIDQKTLRYFLLQNIEYTNGQYLWSINLKSIKKAMDDLRSFPVPEKIKKVDLKSICIFGENSEYVNSRILPSFEKFFSNMSYHQINNAGHFLHVENPDDFYYILEIFLNN